MARSMSAFLGFKYDGVTVQRFILLAQTRILPKPAVFVVAFTGVTKTNNGVRDWFIQVHSHVIR